MLCFAALCRDLFLLAQEQVPDLGPSRGAAWEARITEHLTGRGLPVESVPGGCRILGHASMSGLIHQIDGTFACPDALVVGEWKAHRGVIPKNELLRFKAATDDYYIGLAGAMPNRPIMRVFGGIGRTSAELRCYAALHGITIIDPEHWPAPVLAAGGLRLPDPGQPVPSPDDRRTLGWLCRPIQQVLRPVAGRAFLVAPAPPSSRIQAALDLHDYWSGRLWDAIDAEPEWLERLRSHSGVAVA